MMSGEARNLEQSELFCVQWPSEFLGSHNIMLSGKQNNHITHITHAQMR